MSIYINQHLLGYDISNKEKKEVVENIKDLPIKNIRR